MAERTVRSSRQRTTQSRARVGASRGGASGRARGSARDAEVSVASTTCSSSAGHATPAGRPRRAIQQAREARRTALILSLSHPSIRPTTPCKSSLPHLSPSRPRNTRASSLSSTRPPNPIWSACSSSGCEGGRMASIAQVDRGAPSGGGASEEGEEGEGAASASPDEGRGVPKPERKDDSAESSSACRARRVSRRRV